MEDSDTDFNVKNIKKEESSSEDEFLSELTSRPRSTRKARESRKKIEPSDRTINESSTARERRLRITRERTAENRRNESPESRKRRLRLSRERIAEKRRNESPETRELRRKQQREQTRMKRAQQQAQNSPFSASTSSSISWAAKNKSSHKKKRVLNSRDTNFCRFCLESKGEKEIPREFLKVYESYYGINFDHNDDLPQKICTLCFNKANDCLRFLKNVKDSQPEIREIVNEIQGKDQLLEVEIDSVTLSMQNDPIGDIPLRTVKTECLENEDDFNSFQNEDDSEMLGDDDISQNDKKNFPLLMNPLLEPAIPIKVKAQMIEVSTQEKVQKRQFVKTTKFISANPHRYKRGIRTCDICGFEYNTRAGIKKHIVYEHIKKNLPADKPFQCQECELTFTSNWLRWKHKSSTHFDKGKFVCDECGKQHNDTNQLRKHKLEKHSPKVICTYCAEFICEGAMTLHISMKHKPIDCEYCGQSFQGRIAQKNHIQNTHGREPLACPYCHTIFHNIKKLREHMRTYHNETELHCLVEGCSFATHTRGRMKYHLMYHKNIDESLRERLLAEIDLFRVARGLVQQNM